MTDPNRIDSTPPITSENRAALTQAVSPTGAPLLGQNVTRIAVVLVAIAGVVLTLPAGGVALPPVVLAIAGGVVALGSALGIASPGVRRTDKQ